MPLKYKYIGDERHLTFNSIRNSAFHQLSEPDRSKARRHVERCSRCRSIHESLVRPQKVLKSRSNNKHGAKLSLVVLLTLGLTVSWVHFEDIRKVCPEDIYTVYSWGLMKIRNSAPAKRLPQPPRVELSRYLAQSATKPLVKSIDPIYHKSVITSFNSEQPNQRSGYLEIHGTVTVEDQPLQGVTVMVADSKTAKVSNALGRYNIAVPKHTTSLVFIYQGKQLIKNLHSTSGKLDINLAIENMQYPEVANPLTSPEFIADN